ncbi:MAG TPA: DUF5916 domain-containing protein [Vicinamibacterales bacterium]
MLGRQSFSPALILGLALAFALSRPAVASPQAQPVERPSARAVRITAAIRVDGALDEPAWAQAAPIGPLAQREPDEGAKASEDTEVRVLYTATAMYFGILCRDRTPSAIVSKHLTRDAELESDDNIIVVIDPFLDHRNGFFFQVNPSGARIDGQIANNSEDKSLDWDGIWEASARITPEGWVAEIGVPFKTLRFKPGQTVWGLNVERLIKRRNESDRWATPLRDSWVTNLDQAGRLEGIEGIHQGRGLDIRPYLSGGEENSDGKVQAGIDVFKNLTPNMNASVTVNTDFAETEADARQINLTRFPLFFPEKRAFFLEGAGVFDVAATNEESVLPFFTRRIGLLRGREVPVLVGTKIVGRQSDYNIGVLDVQTRGVDDFGGDGQRLESQNLLAARVSRNIFRQSWIGAIVTHGNPDGTGRNTLVGADIRLATSTFHGNKNLSGSFFVLRTDDEASGTSDYSFGGNIDYPNDLWNCSFGWRQIGDNFRPALGFVPRRGIRRLSPGFSFRPRPGRFGIRQLSFDAQPVWVSDLHNVVQSWEVYSSPFHAEFESGDQVEFNAMPQYERLAEPFEIADGVVIPVGGYRMNRWGVQAETADKRPVVVQAEYSWGEFYSGARRDVQLEITFKPSTHIQAAVQFERNDVSLREGDFSAQVLTLRADYNFSPNVSWANLVQYDSESRLLGVQSRFRWILKPGNDLFLVVNRGWYHREWDNRYLPSFDKGSVKLQYTFRL